MYTGIDINMETRPEAGQRHSCHMGHAARGTLKSAKEHKHESMYRDTFECTGISTYKHSAWDTHSDTLPQGLRLSICPQGIFPTSHRSKCGPQHHRDEEVSLGRRAQKGVPTLSACGNEKSCVYL